MSHSLAYRLDTGEKGMRLEGYGLRKTLNYLRQTYGNPDVYVTENGLADCGTMKDEKRITYIKEYSNNVLKGKIIIYQLIGSALKDEVINNQLINSVFKNKIIDYQPISNVMKGNYKPANNAYKLKVIYY